MEAKLPVAYLTYDGLTDPLGQSQIMPYLSGLAAEGYRFTIISFEKPNRFYQYEKEVNEWSVKNDIEWLPQVYHKRPTVLSTVYDLIWMWIVFRKANAKNKFRIVHCRSYLTSLIGLRAKRKCHTKFIFDMRGFWADERVEGGLWNIQNPLFRIIYKYFKKKERDFLTCADHVVSLTENAKREIQSLDLESAIISVIPTCVDLKLFDPSQIKDEEKEHLRTNLGIAKSDFVLLYLGSWGTWYLTNEMLVCFAKLKTQNKQAKFLIVSSDKIELKDYNYKSDVIVCQSARNLVPLHISISDIAVCLIKPTFSKKASSATKLGEILAMNKRVVTNTGWGDMEIMMAKLGKYVLKHDDYVFNDIEDTQADESARNYCQEYLSLNIGIIGYRQIYERLSI
jgi:glycosyltransferase involved in cell wall biosynthesis